MSVSTVINPIKIALQNPAQFFSFLLGISFFLAVTLLAHFAITFLFNRGIKKFNSQRHSGYSQLLEAIKLPLIILIWVLFSTFVLDKIFRLTAISPEEFNLLAIQKIREIAIIGFFLWITFSYINRMENVYKRTFQKANYNPTLVHALAQLSRLVLGLIGLLILLSNLGISVGSLAAVGGVSAAGIAFAAKGLLGNFFGGLSLYINRPFIVGDKISSPDRSIEGVVEEIGWTLTRIRDIEQRPLYIPNSLFGDIILINLTRRSNLRILTDIGLRYEDADKIDIITSDIRLLLSANPDIDQTKNNLVTFNKMLDSSLNINLSLYTITTDIPEFTAILQTILLDIMTIIARHGAECAFPSRSLYFVNEPNKI
jgi:MscS family membrane protein